MTTTKHNLSIIFGVLLLGYNYFGSLGELSLSTLSSPFLMLLMNNSVNFRKWYVHHHPSIRSSLPVTDITYYDIRVMCPLPLLQTPHWRVGISMFKQSCPIELGPYMWQYFGLIFTTDRRVAGSSLVYEAEPVPKSEVKADYVMEIIHWHTYKILPSTCFCLNTSSSVTVMSGNFQVA